MFLGEISIVNETIKINFNAFNGHIMLSIFLGICSFKTWLVGIGHGMGMAPSR